MPFANYICNALCVWMLSDVLMRSHRSFHSAAGSHTDTLPSGEAETVCVLLLRLWLRTDSRWLTPEILRPKLCIRNIGFVVGKRLKKLCSPYCLIIPILVHFQVYPYQWSVLFLLLLAERFIYQQRLHSCCICFVLTCCLCRWNTYTCTKKKLLLKQKDLLTSTKLIF